MSNLEQSAENSQPKYIPYCQLFPQLEHGIESRIIVKIEEKHITLNCVIGEDYWELFRTAEKN